MNLIFNPMIQLIEERTGIILNERSLEKLLKLLQELSKSQELAGLDNALRENDFSHELWQRIIQVLTVGETYFFRNRNQMSALRNKILPSLIQERRARGFKQVRIWSAGCATGEEPYSISMLLHELIPDIATWSIIILATDINDAYLAFAKQGVYTQRSFRKETESSILEKWFRPAAKGYEVLPKIRQRVVFANMNLKDDVYPSFANHTSNMDIVICRNVTIYFDKVTTNAIIARFYQCLNLNGWLLVGHSEPNLETYRQFESLSLEGSVAYQKIERTASKPVTAPLAESPKTAAFSPLKTPSTGPLKSSTSPLQAKPEKFKALEQAQAAADSGNWDEAMALLDKAEAENNLEPAVHYFRGLVLLELGQIKDSLASLRQSIYCDADFILSHCLLGDAYKREGELKKAQQHWQTAKSLLLKLKPSDKLPFSNDLRADELLDLVMFRLK
jgi:chemotaxis protein methyltransferase CheR